MNDGAAGPAIVAVRPILITGGAGFIGCNLADRLAGEGHHVLVYDALHRAGAEGNLEWLRRRHPQRIAATVADVRDHAALADAAHHAGAVFHLAAQVAVTTSLVDPIADFDVNLSSTLHLLNALRQRLDPVPLIFASTNKVYGSLDDISLELNGDAYMPRNPALREHGIDEGRSLDFHTPYGCSKGGADQYVLDFGRSFGLPTAVLRMSCIYGRRQMGTEDQGWVAHFLIRALRREPITLFGDGCQVRDVLDVSDAVDAYVAAWQRIGEIRGRAYNLGGGPANAVSLRQILDHIGALLGRKIEAEFAGWRPGDQRYYVTDIRRAAQALGLGAPRPWRAGVADLARSLSEQIGAERMEKAAN